MTEPDTPEMKAYLDAIEKIEKIVDAMPVGADARLALVIALAQSVVCGGQDELHADDEIDQSPVRLAVAIHNLGGIVAELLCDDGPDDQPGDQPNGGPDNPDGGHRLKPKHEPEVLKAFMSRRVKTRTH
jgi:hypothetical protein